MNYTPAECMLDLAAIALSDKDKIDCYDGVISDKDWDVTIAIVITSLKLNSADKGLQFRAMVEEWNAQRIIRELY